MRKGQSTYSSEREIKSDFLIGRMFAKCRVYRLPISRIVKIGFGRIGIGSMGKNKETGTLLFCLSPGTGMRLQAGTCGKEENNENTNYK